MRKLYTLSATLMLSLFMQSASAEHNSSWIKIDRIQMAAAAGDVVLVEHAGWQFPSCPEARHALVPKISANFQEMYSLLMMAYQSRDGIIIHGNCTPNVPDHVTITHLFIQDRLDD